MNSESVYYQLAPTIHKVMLRRIVSRSLVQFGESNSTPSLSPDPSSGPVQPKKPLDPASTIKNAPTVPSRFTNPINTPPPKGSSFKSIFLTTLTVSTLFGAGTILYNKDMLPELEPYIEQVKEAFEIPTINAKTLEQKIEADLLATYKLKHQKLEQQFQNDKLSLQESFRSQASQVRKICDDKVKASEEELNHYKSNFDSIVSAELSKLNHDSKLKLESDRVALHTMATEQLEKRQNELESEQDAIINEKIGKIRSFFLNAFESERLSRRKSIAELRLRVTEAENLATSEASYHAISSRAHVLSSALLGLFESLESRKPIDQHLHDLQRASLSPDQLQIAESLLSGSEKDVSGALQAISPEALPNLVERSYSIHSEISKIPKPISTSGVYTIDDIRSEFKVIKKRLLRASHVPSDGGNGIWDHLLSSFISLLTVRTSPPTPVFSNSALTLEKSSQLDLHDSPNEIERLVTEIEDALLLDDLVTAAKLSNKFEGIHAYIIQEWLQETESRILVRNVVDTVSQHVHEMIDILQREDVEYFQK